MATVREHLDRVAHAYAAVIWTGLAGTALAEVADRTLGVPPAVMAAGLAGFLAAVLAILWGSLGGVRCPRCGRPMGESYRRRYFMATDLRACPGCGLDLDGPDRGWPPAEPD